MCAARCAGKSTRISSSCPWTKSRNAWRRKARQSPRLTAHCLQQLPDIAGQDGLAVAPERAQIAHEIAYRRAGADFLRVVGGEHDAIGGNLDQRGLDRADGAGEARGVEHHVVAQIVVEI